jgi:hypothetical protein
MIRIALAALALMLAATAAPASEPEPFTYRWYRKDAYWQHYYCGGRYRPEGCHHYRRHRYAWTPRPPSHCKPRVRIVGWEASSYRGAQTYGERAWFFAVRHDHGAKFANLDRAKNVQFKCDPSTITRVAKSMLWICVVEATPCEATTGDGMKDRKGFSEHSVED